VSKALETKTRTGRGAVRDLPNRFEKFSQDLDPDVVQDDPGAESEVLPNPKTVFLEDQSESIIVKNQSPDVGFSAGINPYRGCEHGCAYCYARPYHEYLGFSAGLEFETKIMVKRRGAELLRRELSRPKYEPQVLGMNGVTDCYQSAERQFRITRSCLEVLAEFRNLVSLITKNFLITRDLDVLKELAAFDAVHVFISITTLPGSASFTTATANPDRDSALLGVGMSDIFQNGSLLFVSYFAQAGESNYFAQSITGGFRLSF
jgi:hypothetical protein